MWILCSRIKETSFFACKILIIHLNVTFELEILANTHAGRDRYGLSQHALKVGFNPRGARPISVNSLHTSPYVSIHAPTRGATSSHLIGLLYGFAPHIPLTFCDSSIIVHAPNPCAKNLFIFNLLKSDNLLRV